MVRAAWLISVGLCSLAWAQAQPAEMQALIELLAEPDPVVREQAANDIIAFGASARPALIAATQSDNPAIRSRAGELLQELPWHREGDPAAVRKLLQNYGKMDERRRLAVASKLAELEEQQGYDALIRLINEETSHGVRWGVAELLRRSSGYGAAKARLRQLDPASDQPAIVLLAGWGWWHIDTGRSHELFRRAIEMERAKSPQPNSELLHAIDVVLLSDALAQKRFEDAAELIRWKISFQEPATSERHPDAALDLLALHAEHGPLKSFREDAPLFRHHLRGREGLYVMARWIQRVELLVAWKSLAAMATSAGANAPNPARVALGEFLMRQQWYELAEAELAAAVQAPEEENRSVVNAGLYYWLAHIAALRKDDAAAADRLEQMIDALAQTNAILRRRGDEGSLAERALRAEAHWRRFRAARERGNADDAQRHLSEMLKLDPGDIEIAIDVVPYLKEHDRADEAKKLFDAAYATLKARLDQEPENPEHMNNLAWLCARSGERLEEAGQLSARAIEAAPENYAYLDTAAEAQFRLGHAAEAVTLEEKALSFRPHDSFMREQLARFRAGM